MSPTAPSPRLVPNPAGYPTYIYIGGVQADFLVRTATLSITDVLNEQPNTASMTVNLTPHQAGGPPFAPHAFNNAAFVTTPTPITYPTIRRGQPITIFSGGLSTDDLIFAGEIVTVRQVYELDKPANVALHLSCTDYTRAINRRKVTKSYPTQSASAIVLDLMASRLADGFTTHHVEASLPAIAIDFTFEEMNRALTRLANRIGGYWYIDYTKDLHFYLAEHEDPPAPLEPGGERFADLAFETDLSQVRTRVVVEGAGTTVTTDVKVGETVVPVRDPVMFKSDGGLAIVGQQRITYGGVEPGGLGSLIGPGAQPASAPTATPALGSGIEAGDHLYAVTFTSLAGESLPSPVASVFLGFTAPATGAPTAGTPTAGNGPDPGAHKYAVTFLTAGGETPPGPVSNTVYTSQVGGVPPPSQPAAALRKVNGNLVSGTPYWYRSTFTTASGETTAGPSSTGNNQTPITPAPPQPELIEAYPSYDQQNGHMQSGEYYYRATYVAGNYTTALGPGDVVLLYDLYNAMTVYVHASPDSRVTAIKIYRTPKTNVNASDVYLVATVPNVTGQYKDLKADSELGALIPVSSLSVPVGTPPGDQALITIPTSGDPRVTGRKLYRAEGDRYNPYRLVGTIANNSATQYIDNAGNISTQPDAPTVDTTGGAYTCVVPLSNIPIGPAGVTRRNLYRTAANGSTLQLVATITNNTATDYTDTKTDAALGVTAPGANSTDNRQVALSKIPIGGSAVTARKIYRSTANAAQLKYVATISDNTTTTYTDALSDLSLGANVPTLDTSGLTQPQGQVNAGATTIPVSSSSAFSAAGGFAVVGNGQQVVRYTGITGTALTGVPSSGPGALTSTVPYNSSITVSPALLGVPTTGAGAIVQRGFVDGEEIHLLVERTDTAAQTALAAIEGGDGIIEHYIQDRRLSIAGATATADAELALFSQPEIRVTYTTRDVATSSGKLIAINLPAPTNLVGEFLIQRVSITQFDIPGIPPLRSVQASSTRFSFEDVLRRLELELSA